MVLKAARFLCSDRFRKTVELLASLDNDESVPEVSCQYVAVCVCRVGV